MNAITLTQPWATLVAIGAKQIETRSWPTDYRGPLAIHAGQGLGIHRKYSVYRALCEQEPFRAVLHGAGYTAASQLPSGCIVAVCELASCLVVSGWRDELCALKEWERGAGMPGEPERSFGDYAAGRYAWMLWNVRRLPEPIPARGALRLWDWQPPEGFAL